MTDCGGTELVESFVRNERHQLITDWVNWVSVSHKFKQLDNPGTSKIARGQKSFHIGLNADVSLALELFRFKPVEQQFDVGGFLGVMQLDD
ncbi:hypothetical protein D3C87_1688980 [compost metagenome]